LFLGNSCGFTSVLSTCTPMSNVSFHIKLKTVFVSIFSSLMPFAHATSFRQIHEAVVNSKNLQIQ